jgi:FIMAH domain-containing protein/beta-propeller repeat-containing protein
MNARLLAVLVLGFAFPAFAGSAPPLIFTVNRGQFLSDVRYAAECAGHRAYFQRDRVTFSFGIALRFVGSNTKADPQGEAPLAGKVNYLTGNDPARWHRNLATFGSIVYRDIWPGIDLRFRGNGGHLEHDLLLRPGADVREIRFAYDGGRKMSIDVDGNLIVSTPHGTLIDQRPRSFQNVEIPTSFTKVGKNEFGIRVSRYDRRLPLVIDPGFIYTTYLGGSGMEFTPQVAITSTGEVIVAGSSASSDFPTTTGALDRTYNGGGFDAVISKFDSTGATLLFSTYLGGSGDDTAEGMAIDGAGNVYITGRTTSHDFPTTPGAYNRTFNGGATDLYVAKLDPTGSSLVYSTYIGGSDTDLGLGIAVSSSGEAYVTGTTLSSDFPTTAGAFDRTFNGGGQDAFVARLNAAGSQLVYSTYIGGATSVDVGERIAVDALGQAYVVGFTDSSDFPVTAGAYDTTFNGGFFTGQDLWVAKLNAAGSALLFSTYLGGSGREFFASLALDSADNVYITGRTSSSDFPTTPGAYDRTFRGSAAVFPEIFDAFVTKLNSSGSALVYSTFLGGTGSDFGSAIAVDASGSAFVAGFTDSTDFPTTCAATDTTANGALDAFLTRLDPTGASLLYSSYLGGSGVDAAQAIALNSSGAVAIAGVTGSSDFPIVNGRDASFNGGAFDFFVAKIDAASLTPQAAIQQMIDNVNSLQSAGALNNGQANALNAKLQAAIQELDKGNPTPAANQLQAFINQIDAFTKAGVLTAPQAQSLLAAANCITAQL